MFSLLRQLLQPLMSVACSGLKHISSSTGGCVTNFFDGLGFFLVISFVDFPSLVLGSELYTIGNKNTKIFLANYLF